MKNFKIITLIMAVSAVVSLGARAVRSSAPVVTPQRLMSEPIVRQPILDGPKKEMPVESSTSTDLPPIGLPPVLPQQPKVLEESVVKTRERGIKRTAGGTPTVQQQVKEKRSLPTTKPALSMEEYATKKVASLAGKIVEDLPKRATIERLVNDFKDEYPGSNEEGDTAILYNAIMKNPEIKKSITLDNAVNVYNFVKETIGSAWYKQNEIIWSR